MDKEEELLESLTINLDIILDLLPANAYNIIRKAASAFFSVAHQIYGIAHELRNRLSNHTPPTYKDVPWTIWWPAPPQNS